jgi:timeless
MRFFMEFNRHYKFRPELISETLTKHTFHYVQQQIDNYKDNLDHEKRNRPQALLWAKRVHLGLRAYCELLSNLISLETDKVEEHRKSAQILKASVFYEPEYRELCLDLFNVYRQERFPLSFLKDLVETSHVFLKILEHMSKAKQLVVGKKVRKRKSTKKGAKAASASSDVLRRMSKEDEWDAISSGLTSLLQLDDDEARAAIPSDVTPFDATLDLTNDEQKAASLIRIQSCLRKRQLGVAVALLRASREVWPENDVFGAEDADPEDDFMTLREILAADIPRPENLPDLDPQDKVRSLSFNK